MRAVLCSWVVLVSCSGPAASDAALCRDVAHRLCIPPICDEVTTKFAIVGDCETFMVAHAACGDETFMFKPPLDRDTFLNCRLPLLRNGDNVDTAPDCLDVGQTFDACPALVQLYGGTP
jgi:hypothetical protein